MLALDLVPFAKRKTNQGLTFYCARPGFSEHSGRSALGARNNSRGLPNNESLIIIVGLSAINELKLPYGDKPYSYTLSDVRRARSARAVANDEY